MGSRQQGVCLHAGASAAPHAGGLVGLARSSSQCSLGGTDGGQCHFPETLLAWSMVGSRETHTGQAQEAEQGSPSEGACSLVLALGVSESMSTHTEAWSTLSLL